jgi:ribosomal protein L11 methyltransferase
MFCMEYAEVIFENVSADNRELLIAQLSAIGFHGFHEEDTVLKAYISTSDFNSQDLHALAVDIPLAFTVNTIADQNWNQVWESNFDPVIVDDFCAIRANFHPPIPSVAHEIVITPKMSFGTGHHATTYMMISSMKNLAVAKKHVLDFGTGTGVLAILAAQLHASRVVAIDNDEWSIENARENFHENKVAWIELVHTDTPEHSGYFDIILANVTRNVIAHHFPSFVHQLNPNGILLLSGLLEGDETEISSLASQFNLTKTSTLKRDKWICIQFVYNI